MKVFSVLSTIIILLGLSLYASANEEETFVYIAKHQGYTCERWGNSGYKDSRFEEDGFKFDSLGISKSTRRIRIQVSNSDDTCQYAAYFDRQKGNKFGTFDFSETTGDGLCEEFASSLDQFMMQGWDYEIKLNKYLSVYFNAGIDSRCNDETGESYARFIYDILAE